MIKIWCGAFTSDENSLRIVRCYSNLRYFLYVTSVSGRKQTPQEQLKPKLIS